jgi:hypothetical protein
MTSNQIQMKNRKNQSIDQNTWPVPQSAANRCINVLLVYRTTRSSWSFAGSAVIIPHG